jgi:hypothetical protein
METVYSKLDTNERIEWHNPRVRFQRTETDEGTENTSTSEM